MSAKITASADGTTVTFGTAAENALQINATAKTIKPVSPYQMAGNGPAFRATGATVAPVVNVLAKVPVQTEVFDTNSNYDAFGLYLAIMKNGSTTLSQGGSTGNASAFARATAAAIEYMNGTTDYVEVWITPLGPSGTLNVVCSDFSGALVRAA